MAKKKASKKKATKAAAKPAKKKSALPQLDVHALATEFEAANTVNLTGGQPVVDCLIGKQRHRLTEKQCRRLGGKPVAAEVAAPHEFDVHAVAAEFARVNTVNLAGGEPVGSCWIHNRCQDGVTERQCDLIGGDWSPVPCG